MQEIIVYVLLAALAAIVAVWILRERRLRARAGREAAGAGTVNTMVLETINDLTMRNYDQFEVLRNSVDVRLAEMQRMIDHQLDSKLQTGLDSSFNRIHHQLQKVNESMGEVRALTHDIGDLKGILSGVKTRGIWGEVQLQKLLDDFLAPGQYLKDARIGGDGVVEFAVLFSDGDKNKTLLPIDSKFPMERYARVLRHEEDGNREKMQKSKKELVAAVLAEAKKIQEKYVKPPETTEFAIMFLPSESLYLEIGKLGMLEQLQSMWNIMVAGPSTLCALLTSLQAGFRAMALRARGAEVFDLLVRVRHEMKKHINGIEQAARAFAAAQNHMDAVKKGAERMQRRLDAVHGMRGEGQPTTENRPAAGANGLL